MTRPDETNLPPWLRGVPLPPKPASQSAGASAAPAAPPPAPAETPSWLMGGESPAPASAGEEEELPDWLRSLSEIAPSGPAAPAPQAEATTPPPRAPGFTGWLSNTADPAPPAPAPAPAESDVPAWLRAEAASAPPPEPEGEGDVPAWLRAEAASAPAADDEPLPDWLHSLQQGAPDADDEPAAPGDSAWAQSSPLPTGSDDVTTPAWLREPEPPPATAPPPAAAPPPPPASDDIPSWLSSMPDETLGGADQDGDLEIAPFSLGDAPPAGTTSEWLGASASQLIGSGNKPEEADDLPAWLRADGTDSQPTPPAWASPAASPPPSAAPQPPRAEDTPPDIPSWLRDAAGPIPPDEPPTWSRGPDSPTSSDHDATLDQGGEPTDVPAWLQDAGAALPLAAAEPAAEALPSWLREQHTPADSGPAPRDSAAQPPPDAGQEGDELPSWLRTGVPAEPPPIDTTSWVGPAPAAPLPDAADASDLPSWLRETAATPAPSDPSSESLPPWLRDDEGSPLPIAVAPEDANLPAWLRGSDADVSAPVAPPQPAAPAQQSAPAQQPGAPPSLDWFDDGPSTGAAAAQQGSSDLLGGADLPAWLRPETEKPRDTSLDWLARLGPVEDDSPMAAGVEAPPRLTLPPAPVRTPAQMEALSVLRRMAADPLAVPPPQPQPAAAGRLQRIGLERMLSVVLLLLLIVGVAVPGLADGLAEPQPTPAAIDLIAQVEQLSEQDTVLIGYEWDAQRISELRPLEQAVITQLLAKKVRVVLVSTDPQGTLLQFDLYELLNQSGYQGGGLDYILLGYRPGGEIGLRQLAQDLRGALQRDFQSEDATQGLLATAPDGTPRLTTLNDFAMAIVFADEPTDVQAWMEQIRPAMARPITFLVPASVAPMAQPYFRQEGIFHLAGIEDAISYRQLRGDVDAQALQQAGQLHLAALLFAGLLTISVVGVLIYETAARRRRAP